MVSGNISLSNNCGFGGNMPPITVTLSTNPVQTTTTDGNGNFSFTNVPAGSYTVTPSVLGASSLFSPASQNLSVSNGNATPGFLSFQVVLGYTVSGTVAYSGSQSGQVYLQLTNNNCGGTTYGTSIAAATLKSGGAFQIRGVPPGNYTLQAWMDNLGYGAQNASNPAGGTEVSVPSTTISDQIHRDATPVGNGITVTLIDPVALSLAPYSPTLGQAVQSTGVTSTVTYTGGGGFSGGAFIPYQAITRQIVCGGNGTVVCGSNNNGNGVELATSYTVQWSTTSNFNTVAGSKSFPARGTNGAEIWIVTGLTGGPYYFRAQGVGPNVTTSTDSSELRPDTGQASNNTSGWSNVLGPITIGAPSTGNSVSGTVTFTGKATGPLYVGFYDQQTENIYVDVVGSKSTPPTSPASYSVKVPTGSNYYFFGIIDQNNDGLVNVGDITNTDSNNNNSVSIPSSGPENLTLPGASYAGTLTTSHSEQSNPNCIGGTCSGYSLNFDVRAGIMQPVAVTLLSGPNVLTPQDIGLCANCGHTQFNFWFNTIGNVAPKVGDTYTLRITYTDGTSIVTTGSTGNPADLSLQVSAVLNAFATNLSPQGAITNTTPNFSWTYPSNAGSYIYQFQLEDSNYNTIWEIPCQNGNNCNSNGFTSSISPSITWGTDPTGNTGNTPSESPLSGGNYYWSIRRRTRMATPLRRR